MVDSTLTRVTSFSLLGYSGTGNSLSLVADISPNGNPPTDYIIGSYPFVWANGLMTPPTDTPICGFQRENCPLPES